MKSFLFCASICFASTVAAVAEDAFDYDFDGTCDDVTFAVETAIV